ncbi:hypothetical protein V6N13_128564 [Hibiscus sabdariffa]
MHLLLQKHLRWFYFFTKVFFSHTLRRK